VPELPEDQDGILSDSEMTVLRALRPAFNVLMRGFDAELTRLHGLTHTEYLVLMSLSEAKDQALRMTDLAATCQQSLSSTSRTITRLEATGLVSRDQAPHDARSFDVSLTDEGLRRFKAARLDHLHNVQHSLFDHLDGVDVESLGKALETIAGHRNGDR
jgi:DNA-binding MarR family transcriptional regulator